MTKLDQMVKLAKKLGFTNSDLDWLVNREKNLEADKINNRGYRSQLRYLLAGHHPELTLKKLKRELTIIDNRIRNSEE
jgi:hypothetical protein